MALDISAEKVSYIVALAREIEDALPSDGSIEDESHRGEALDQELVEEHSHDANYQGLRGHLETLTDDELTALTALFWLGRGTFDRDELDTALTEARAVGIRRIPGYLLSQTLLAEHLEEGMMSLGLTAEEF